MTMRHLHSSRHKAFALPAALATIILLGFVVLAIVELLRGPVRLLGDSARRDQDLVATESLLELARARWIRDPGIPPNMDGLTIAPSTTDSCLWTLNAQRGVATITETWLVTAPTSFAAYLDSAVLPPFDTSTTAPIHLAIAGLCETGLIDTEAFENVIGRRLVMAVFSGQTVRNEVIYLRPVDSAVLLADLRIDCGFLIVDGDAVLSGSFEGKAREDWPLLVVTGSLLSEAHGTPWTMRGLVAIGKDAYLAGPLTLEGTILARTLSGIGTVTGRPLDETEPTYRPLGFRPRIRVIGRHEEFSR